MSLQVHDLSFRYGQRPILEEIGFSVEAGNLIGVLGENGSGKTTLLKLIAGIEQPQQGKINWRGASFSDMSASERAVRTSYLAQRTHPAWGLPAEDVVRLGVMPRNDWSETQKTLAIREAMAATDVTALASRSVHEVSAGELQRVLLARAIASNPELLLADEPVSGLDPRHQLDVMGLLKERSKRGALVCVVLHDLAAARKWCDRVVVLKNKKVHVAGPAIDTLTDELIAEVFGV